MNLKDIVILAVVVISLASAFKRMISLNKKGGCCGNCSGCKEYGRCSKPRDKTEDTK